MTEPTKEQLMEWRQSLRMIGIDRQDVRDDLLALDAYLRAQAERQQDYALKFRSDYRTIEEMTAAYDDLLAKHNQYQQRQAALASVADQLAAELRGHIRTRYQIFSETQTPLENYSAALREYREFTKE